MLAGSAVSTETLGQAVRHSLDRKVCNTVNVVMVLRERAGELVPAFEVFDAVSSGTAEMGHGAAYYWKGKSEAAQFFASVPFGMNAQELAAWFYYGDGLSLWREVYEPFGLIPAPAGNTGVQMGGWFNKEINGLADLEGLKMRIPGLGGEVLRRAGGTPVNLPGGEIFTALQTGSIDATEWVGPYNDLAFGLHQVARYYYYPGWHEPGTCLEAMFNAEAFAALPEDLRTAIMLREIDGMSYEDIATTMECPIGTVRSRIFRAREAIDEKLKPLVEGQ